MAPVDVLSEAVAVNITYVKAATVDDLRQAGVRIVGVEELATLIAQAKNELFPKLEEAEEPSASPGTRCAPMRLPAVPWVGQKWQNAIYKPGRGGAKPPWEVSYERWATGASINSIAMQQDKGKSVQPSTIVGHLLNALTFAKPLDLARLFREGEITPPNEAEWKRLEEAAAERGANVDSLEYKSKDVLGGVLGVEKVSREPAEKSDSDKEEEKRWYDKIRIWEALKRASFPASFGDDEPEAKRQRVA